MIREAFVQGSSLVHQLDPMVRMISACILSVSAALCENLYLVAACLVPGMVLLISAKLDLKAVINRFKPVFIFLAALWIVLPLTFDKTDYLMFFNFQLSKTGILMSAKISIKAVAILLIFTTLISTMTISTLGHTLHRLYVPDKMVFLLLMAYRYIGVIENEYKRLLRAAKLRGFRPGTNLHSYRTYAYMAGMLFVRASIRANRVYQAMRCRGFNNKFHTLDIYSKTRSNPVFLFMSALMSILLMLAEHVWMVK